MDIMKAYAVCLCMSGVQNKSSDQQGMNILFISFYITIYFFKNYTQSWMMVFILHDVLLTRKN